MNMNAHGGSGHGDVIGRTDQMRLAIRRILDPARRVSVTKMPAFSELLKALKADVSAYCQNIPNNVKAWPAWDGFLSHLNDNLPVDGHGDIREAVIDYLVCQLEHVVEQASAPPDQSELAVMREHWRRIIGPYFHVDGTKKEPKSKAISLHSRVAPFDLFSHDGRRPLVFDTKLSWATHVPKMRSGDAGGSIALATREDFSSLIPDYYFGSHTTASIYRFDGVGNAQVNPAATIWENVIFEGDFLINLARNGDVDAIAAMADPYGAGDARESGRLEEYREWIAPFVHTSNPFFSNDPDGESPVLDERTPQVYWLSRPGGSACNDGRGYRDNDFVLLAPLPSMISSLDLTIKIRELRLVGYALFRDDAEVDADDFRVKERNRTNTRLTRGFLNSGIAFVKVGGAQPQNVSFLANTHGRNGFSLLPSFPPRQADGDGIPARLRHSAVGYVMSRSDVRTLLRQRADMLLNGGRHQEVTGHRSQYESHLRELLKDAPDDLMKVVSPGWSAGEGFDRLAAEEAVWMDPMRAVMLTDDTGDAGYLEAIESGLWAPAVIRKLAKALAETTMDMVRKKNQGRTPGHLAPTWTDDDAAKWRRMLRLRKALKPEVESSARSTSDGHV